MPTTPPANLIPVYSDAQIATIHRLESSIEHTEQQIEELRTRLRMDAEALAEIQDEPIYWEES